MRHSSLASTSVCLTNALSPYSQPHSLLQLLLRAEHVRVAALLLAAIHGASVQPGVALAADHLLAIVLARKHGQRGLDDTTAEAQHQVQGGLLLDVVIAQGASVLQLLARENQTLLVWRYPFLVLNLSFHVVDRVRGLHIERNGLT